MRGGSTGTSTIDVRSGSPRVEEEIALDRPDLPRGGAPHADVTDEYWRLSIRHIRIACVHL
jgi:hypothetical protein